jgi:hypothetical protein
MHKHNINYTIVSFSIKHFRKNNASFFGPVPFPSWKNPRACKTFMRMLDRLTEFISDVTLDRTVNIGILDDGW